MNCAPCSAQLSSAQLNSCSFPVLEEVEKCKIQKMKGLLWNAVFWTGHGYHSHELTITHVTYTRPVQGQASQSSSMDGEVLSSPHPGVSLFLVIHWSPGYEDRGSRSTWRALYGLWVRQKQLSGEELQCSSPTLFQSEGRYKRMVIVARTSPNLH